MRGLPTDNLRPDAGSGLFRRTVLADEELQQPVYFERVGQSLEVQPLESKHHWSQTKSGDSCKDARHSTRSV